MHTVLTRADCENWYLPQILKPSVIKLFLSSPPSPSYKVLSLLVSLSPRPPPSPLSPTRTIPSLSLFSSCYFFHISAPIDFLSCPTADLARWAWRVVAWPDADSGQVLWSSVDGRWRPPLHALHQVHSSLSFSSLPQVWIGCHWGHSPLWAVLGWAYDAALALGCHRMGEGHVRLGCGVRLSVAHVWFNISRCLECTALVWKCRVLMMGLEQWWCLTCD